MSRALTRILEVTILVLIIALLLVSILSNMRLLPEYWAAVGSYSMVPTLEIGDLVVLLPPHVTNMKTLLGKVVVYNSPLREEIIHRVIRVVDNECVETKGDANPVPDPFCVKLQDIRGVVQVVLPYIGFPSVVLRSLFNNGLSSLFILLSVAYIITLMLVQHLITKTP